MDSLLFDGEGRPLIGVRCRPDEETKRKIAQVVMDDLHTTLARIGSERPVRVTVHLDVSADVFWPCEPGGEVALADLDLSLAARNRLLAANLATVAEVSEALRWYDVHQDDFGVAERVGKIRCDDLLEIEVALRKRGKEYKFFRLEQDQPKG